MKKHSLIIPLLLAFMACTNDAPELPGVFSVSKTRQIQFSPGVLKYKASTDTWRFADSQLDFVGKGNEKISPTYNGWIDLFGYGTSGYNGVMPYLCTHERSDYAPTGDDGITGTEYDWGIHCQIENGGPKGSWRLPTNDDWYWILSRRENFLNLATLVYVDTLAGLLVLPDGWENTTGIQLQFPDRMLIDDAFPDLAAQNRLTKAQFKKLEKIGALFCPCMGIRVEKKYSRKGACGYWTSNSLYEGAKPWILITDTTYAVCASINAYFGCYVRLVKDVQTK
ncbi:MAG: hypothetical protein IJ882_03640 [Paludibacteraceae bacterium]|nr:hypothetical protein [Paludibacteraceae bacterium]